jgi:acyl-CoA thioesterase-1
MLKANIKQLNLNFKVSTPNIFLKFGYFFCVILLFSCGSDTSKKSEIIDKALEKTDIETPEKVASKKMVFFGDSLTAGYGLENINDAFPALIQTKIDSLSLNYEVINSGLSGETSAGGKSRVNWVLNQKVAIFVLELGANDGLRGIPLKETKNNLQAIIDAVLAKNEGIKIVLAGMQLPPNMGIDYSAGFKAIFPELAKKNGLELIPFLLKDVGGIPELNQADGIHPTVEGQKILANNVWTILKPMLKT